MDFEENVKVKLQKARWKAKAIERECTVGFAHLSLVILRERSDLRILPRVDYIK